ncbi:MAG: CoA-transferase [Bacillota bacterium]
MAMAADTVLVEAEEIVATGSLDANKIMTPGVFVDYIVDFA